MLNIAIKKQLSHGQEVYDNKMLLFFFLQNWMAYEHCPLSWEAKESSAVNFSENEVPSTRDSYALCKVWITPR